MHNAARAVLAMALFCLAGTAFAEEETQQLGAHEHGHGTLSIAIEGNTAKMELEVPGMDIVGFEHEASTPEQQALVDTARKDLGEGILGLLVLSEGAGCKLDSNTVSVVAEEHHDEGAEKKEDAGTEAEHEEHHNVFRGSYQLSCSAPQELTSIDFPFFERFSGAQELDVTVINDKGQNAYEVERDAPKLELSRQ